MRFKTKAIKSYKSIERESLDPLQSNQHNNLSILGFIQLKYVCDQRHCPMETTRRTRKEH